MDGRTELERGMKKGGRYGIFSDEILPSQKSKGGTPSSAQFECIGIFNIQ